MRPAFAIVLSLPLVLTGCSLSPTAAPLADAGLSIQGSVRGGQQPIVGAHVYLFAANTTGYGNASVSLMTSVLGSTTLDASGGATNGDYYVTTGAGGAFSITGDYSCTPNTQVYLYSLGGNPGSGVNSGAGMLAALGNCPSGGNFLTATPYVVVNEVSTIAAAYSFAGFATDATHVSSSGTALAQVGIQNAFANAANLEGLSTGVALATTPNGNGTAPQSEIYTLADILASCINSDGTISGPTNPTACYTLFNNAKSGGSTGTVPSDTATAAINIAHNPGANVASLYALVTAQAPFGSTLGAQPNDFTVGLQFTGGGLNDPYDIAIDGSGNAWITNNGTGGSVTKLTSTGVPIMSSTGYTGNGLTSNLNGIAIDLTDNAWIPATNNNSVVEISSTGSFLSGSTGYTGGGLNFPFSIAIDGSGNAWVTNIASGHFNISEFSSAGTAVTGSNGYTDGTLSTPYSIAIDGTGNVWVADKGNSKVTELSSAGAALSGVNGYSGGGVNVPYSIAIDNSGNAWLADTGGLNTNVAKLSSGGVAISPSTGYTGGGVDTPVAVAIDGSGNAWVANNGTNISITELANNGTAISPSTGYIAPGVNSLNAIAVDGSGNVWVADKNALQITEMIGLATPVVTPLSVGAKNNTLGHRP